MTDDELRAMCAACVNDCERPFCDAVLTLLDRVRDRDALAAEVERLKDERDGWNRNACEVAGHAAEYCLKIAKLTEENAALRERLTKSATIGEPVVRPVFPICDEEVADAKRPEM